MTILAHFDGKVIVPDGPVDLPLGASLELEVKHTHGISPEVRAAMEAAQNSANIARRLAAFDQFILRIGARPTGRGIASEALRREQLYGDAGR
jgi:hypothetical protein